MFDIIVIIVILVVVFGSSFLEEHAKKQMNRVKKQYDYDAKVVKDYWTPIKKFFDDWWESSSSLFSPPSTFSDALQELMGRFAPNNKDVSIDDIIKDIQAKKQAAKAEDVLNGEKEKEVNNKKDKKKEVEKMEKNGLAGIVTVVVLFVIAILMCNPIVVVGVGERGVKVTLGKVSPESLGEGMHFIMPYVQKIARMDVKTQKYNTQTHVYTKDIQQAKISYVVNYNLLADSAYRMYQEVGMDYVSKVINPVLEGSIKDVIGKWNAQDLVANREEATNDILVKLREQLNERYVNVTGFQIVDINYSEVFERAIESKVTAEQDALKAKNKTVQIQEEARQKVISAEAEAKSMSIRANALTQNKALVEYEAVQKWNGILPHYMMGNSVPFINLK